MAVQPNQNQEALSQEDWVEKSWDFLNIITEMVERLSPEVQSKILEAGRQFAKAGASYNHDDHKPYKPSISPAKAAALKESSQASSPV